MKKRIILPGILLAIFYFILLLIFKSDIFSYRFDKDVVDRYLHSQNIFGDVKNRIFVSDEVIYIASGYLYVHGANPTQYNFEHPPLIKYLFGLSILIFQNPYVVQVAFGLILLWLTYYLGIRIYDNRRLAFLAGSLLLVDPLFLNSSTEAMLDIGHSVFGTFYLISAIFYPAHYLFQAVALGLIISSKFWATGIFFIIAVLIYNHFVMKRKINWRCYLYSFAIAALIYLLTYWKIFLDLHGRFNFVFFQLKMLKYWLQHNISSYFGASVVLFLTGFFKSWWGKQEVLRTNVWSIFWPVSFLATICNLSGIKKWRREHFFFVIPLIYLFYLGVQAPFARYFIPVLPFFYLSLGYFLLKLVNFYLKVYKSTARR